MRRIAALVMALLLAVAGDSAAWQLMRPEFASVGGAVVATTPLLPAQLVRAAVLLKVEPGLHVNANPASESWLIATEASLEAGEGVSLRRAFYPEALEKEFGFYSGPLRVYEGEVVIGLEIEIGPDVAGDRDLEIRIRYQACNDEACFAPADATYRLPVLVAPPGTATRAVASPLLLAAPFPSESDEPLHP